MCGIIGIIEKKPSKSLKNDLISGMTYLQHRGQDSAGIALIDPNGKVNIHKDIGLVSNVFSKEPKEIQNDAIIGIGHVRYSTQGDINISEAQPFYINYPFGITMAHNGNITNTDELLKYLKNNLHHINTNSDSEILLNVIASKLCNTYKNNNTISNAIKEVMMLVKGSYSVIVGISGVGILAFRDPFGIRPLCYGKSANDGYMFASESVALIGSQYELVNDVEPGEIIIVDYKHNLYKRQLEEYSKKYPCLFEYIYFARPDSIIDGISVYEAREQMGYFLGKEILKNPEVKDFHVVIPVPETSRTFAIKVAEILNKPYRDAFIKNRYIARTFIMSNKENNQNRSKMVKMKLNTIKKEFENKNVIIVDDSIVRGTTSKELIKLARDSGAKKIWFASASPPIRYANRLGIDIQTKEELIAYNKTENKIAEELGCERVYYNDLHTICKNIKILKDKNSYPIDGFETSCFDGKEFF